MSTILTFKSIQNKHVVYSGKDCMKRFCKSLIGLAMEIINFKKKQMKQTNQHQKLYKNAKNYYICKVKIEDKQAKDKKYRKVNDHCHYTGKYRGAAHNKCNLKYSFPKEIPMVFHNGSNYDYHFTIKELAE